MNKKIISLFLSFALTLLILTPAFSASAATYKETLINSGFPEDYAVKLDALHTKYPKWNFVPLITGLSFSEALAGERKSHRSQIIQTSYSDKYFCSCSSCKKKGSYVKPYSGCYCASEWAVSYFMDPRNWLDEQYIFQFEDNHYNSAHNSTGVEKIISSTWMSNSNIVYTDTLGNTVDYGEKYSKAILEAAKSSNMSAYYIASRIVKEVGTKNPSNVSGVAGNKLPFTGIYNFYSIGATSGGMSGLEWASGWLMASKATTMYEAYNITTKMPIGNKTAIKGGQYMSYLGTYNDYYFVRLYTTGSGYSTNGAVGVIPISDLRTTYFTYERPWTNPYKSIVGGAKYIADGYLQYQYTGYLEKFNVNKASGKLYSHEYMQNVDAPSKEALSRYKAYSSANQLSNAKTFYIPVYTDMTVAEETAAAEQTTQVQNLGVTAVSPTVIKIKWNAVNGASEYKVRIKNLTKGTTFYKSVKSSKAKLKNLTNGNEYKIDVKAKVSDAWARYSESLTQRCLPKKVTLSSVISNKTKQLNAIWKKTGGASGYQVCISTDKKFKNNVTKVIVDSKTLSNVFKKLKSGKTYYVKVRAYTTLGNKKYYGKFSSKKKVVIK